MYKQNGTHEQATEATDAPSLGSKVLTVGPESLEPNVEEAQRFLAALAPDGLLTFQTLPDSEEAKKVGYLHRKIRHGTFAEHRKFLISKNQNGVGVFLMVNQGDRHGRKEANVKAIRALFVDLDGAPLGPVEKAGIPPSIIVETSPGRYHAYWLVQDMPLKAFKAAQKALAVKFGGDVKVNDLPRLMRLPGMFHHKHATPFLSKLLKCESELVWHWHDLASGLSLPMPMSLPDRIPDGERNSTIFKLAVRAAMQGVPETTERDRLKKINEERCVPPLSDAELSGIITNAYKHKAEGAVCIPLALFDDPRFVSLGKGPKALLLMLYQRVQTKSDLWFPILWDDFQPHFPRDNTFKIYRSALEDAGLIQLKERGRKPAGVLKATANKYQMTVTGGVYRPCME